MKLYNQRKIYVSIRNVWKKYSIPIVKGLFGTKRLCGILFSESMIKFATIFCRLQKWDMRSLELDQGFLKHMCQHLTFTFK